MALGVSTKFETRYAIAEISDNDIVNSLFVYIIYTIYMYSYICTNYIYRVWGHNSGHILLHTLQTYLGTYLTLFNFMLIVSFHKLCIFSILSIFVYCYNFFFSKKCINIGLIVSDIIFEFAAHIPITNGLVVYA